MKMNRGFGPIVFLYQLLKEEKQYFYMTMYGLIFIPLITLLIINKFISLEKYDQYAYILPIYIGFIVVIMLFYFLIKHKKSGIFLIIILITMLLLMIFNVNTPDAKILQYKIKTLLQINK